MNAEDDDFTACSLPQLCAINNKVRSGTEPNNPPPVPPLMRSQLKTVVGTPADSQ